MSFDGVGAGLFYLGGTDAVPLPAWCDQAFSLPYIPGRSVLVLVVFAAE